MAGASAIIANLTLNATAVVTTVAPGGYDGFQIDMTWVIKPISIGVCGVATLISCIICFADMWQHVGRFEHPRLQAGTLRILFMIPVYSVFSFLTLVVPETRFFLRTLRDTYEAFVLYQFLALLIEYCGGEAQLVQSLQRKHYKGVHPFPMCWLPMFQLDRAFYVRCQRWVLQYAVIKPLTAVLALLTHPFGIYDESNLDFSWNVYAWTFLVNNFAITWSLWYLVVFHNEVEKELHYCKPLLKFVCIKSIIFFSYWQTAALGVMLSMGMVYTGSTAEEQEEVGSCIQEFLMCIELLPISVLHHYGFGVDKLEEEMKEHPLYESAANVRRGESRLARLDEALSLRQFFRDLIDAVVAKSNQLRHDITDGKPTGNGITQDDDGTEMKGGTKQTHAMFSKLAWPHEAVLKLVPPSDAEQVPGSVAVPVDDDDGSEPPSPSEDRVNLTAAAAAAGAAGAAPAGAATVSVPVNLARDLYGDRADEEMLHSPNSPAGVSPQIPWERRSAPIPVEAPGKATITTLAALELCGAVSAVHGSAATTADVFHAAVMLELAAQRRRGQPAGAAGAAGPGQQSNGAAGGDINNVDVYADWSSSDDAMSDQIDSEDDEAQNDRAARNAFRFGLKADDFQIVVKTASTINNVFQRVLFDETATTTTHFCVVCGRSDREMIQRKSGLKCKECMGMKHNYQDGAAI
jgi:hypothetical protein